MAISLQDNLDIRNKKQNVERDSFKTIEEMRSFPSTSLPPVFHAMCEDDGCLYIYNVNNSENDTTGKWRKFECSANGTGGTNGKDGVSPTVSITTTDTGHTVKITDVNGVNSFDVLNGEDGVNGTNGQDGTDGIGITKIEKTKTEGLVDTYTITFSDDSTFEYTVTNGKDGKNGSGSSTGEENVIESIKVNGVVQTVADDKSVDITVPTVDVDKNYVDTELAKKANTSDIPTKVSELQNDSNYQTNTDVTTTLTPYATKTYVEEQISNVDLTDYAKTALEAHTNSIVSSKTGVHGMRYFNDTLQVQNEAGEWVDIETGGSAGTIMPKPVSNATIKNKNAQCIITWQDPDDFVLDGVVLADWKGTKLVMSETSFPTNEQDGTLVVDNTEKGKYATDGYTVNNLVNGTTYYFTLFTYSSDGAYNYKQAVHLTGQLSLVKLDPCTNITAVASPEKVTVTWTDPDETKTVDGNTATWAKTVLVYKEGLDAPTSIDDGTVAVEEQTRNQYQTTGYDISGLEDGKDYSISLFAVSTDGAVSDPISITGIHLYATLFITTDESTLYEKQITATLGSKTVNGIIDDAGQASLSIPWTGETTVTATDSENTATNKVTIEEFNKTYEVKLSFVKIVTFANGTDEEIKAMIEAHYANKINIRDYWAVGDKRTVHLSAMSATGVGESHREQDVQMAIADFDHDELTTTINGHTEAAVTLTQVDCLMDANNASNPVNGANNTENGYMNSTNTNNGGWKDCSRRTWCNNAYFNALPSAIKNAVKSVNKKTSTGSQNNSTIDITSDKVFLLSEVEIYGTITYSVAGEGSQYTYYETTSNRYKNPKLSSSSNSCLYWPRSPYSSNSTYFCLVNNDGSANSSLASNAFGLAPCLCI